VTLPLFCDGMKTTITLKEFGDLSPGAVQITHATAAGIPKPSPQPVESSGEDFREMMRRRYTTPFPYQRWGLNE
jgi:hypothetical protein